MDRVETPKAHTRRECGCLVQEVLIDRDLIHAAQLATGVRDGRGTAGAHGAYDLDASEHARDAFGGCVPPQEPAQGGGLDLTLHELHDGGGVEVELQRSPSRMADNSADAAIP